MYQSQEPFRDSQRHLTIADTEERPLAVYLFTAMSESDINFAVEIKVMVRFSFIVLLLKIILVHFLSK